MPRCQIGSLIAFAVGLSCAWAHAEPKSRVDGREVGADDVKLVLQREQHAPIDRRAELQTVLKRQPDLAVARWHSGQVATPQSWRSYDSPAESEMLEGVAEYRHRRTILDKTFRSQMQMAHWCRQQGLRDQERAHLLAAAALDDATPTERATVYERLGYQQWGSQWLSPGEIAEWTALGRQGEASLKHWGPILERVANRLEGNSHQRRAAREALGDIRDPAAIPAIESVLLPRGEMSALAAIELLAQIEAYQSSQALARVAMFANSVAVRSAAIEALTHRRMDDYVPTLIELLSTDVEPRFQRVGVDRGVAFFTYLLVREHDDQIDVRARTVMHPRVEALHIHYLINAHRIVVSRPPVPIPTLDVVRNEADRVYQEERQIRQQNDAIGELNDRTIKVLSAVSGLPPSLKPREWWNWWDQVSDRQRVHGKTVVRVDEFSVSEIALPVGVGFSKGSCFLAGTPVWTETGPVPIEELQIGDRVLAQNVETGELAYKPVLQATVRPPKQLVGIGAGDEQIVCTGGHRFWAPGEGWVKARDLEPSRLLHTAAGTVRVDSLSEAQTDKTHNLVVADFHSYFVGKQAFLVQDLPLPRSTNCVVPGLQPEWK